MEKDKTAAGKKEVDPKELTTCEATAEMLTKARLDGVTLATMIYSQQRNKRRFILEFTNHLGGSILAAIIYNDDLDRVSLLAGKINYPKQALR